MNVACCVIRLLIAIVLGYAVGLERKVRYSDAGPRTHAMVSMGACIFMIISLYCFPKGTYDTSRVSASIVTGISFLGAGNIIYNRGNLHGLTTGAGIWVTAGIGMAVGSGEIYFSVIATGVLVIFQIISHIPIPFLHNRNRYIIKISYEAKENKELDIKKIIKYDKVLNCKYKQGKESVVCCLTVLINTHNITIDEMVDKLRFHKEINSIEFLDRK